MSHRVSRFQWNLTKPCKALVLMLLIFSFLTASAHGTSYRTPSAIESNLLTFDGKLAFVQGTGGLTVIDMDTGRVILRKLLGDELGYVQYLYRCPTGVLLASYDKATLIDKNSLQPLWTIEDCKNLVVEGSYIVAHDGWHTVRCYDSETGKERWSQEIQGGWDLTLSKGIVVVSTVPYYDKQSTLWVIDAKSGKQLFHKTPPPGEQWCDVHCDGMIVYAITMPLTTTDFQEIPNGIIKYDVKGQELERLKFSSPQIQVGDKSYKYPFLLDGKMFERGENCRPAYQHELQPHEEPAIPDDTYTFSLPAGVLMHERIRDSAHEIGHVVRLTAADSPWAVFLPYIRPHEYLNFFEEIDGRILLCSSGGQIECLDSATGRPQWLYVFPSFRRLLSYSDSYIGNYRQSHETGQAKLYYQGLSHLGEKCGSIIIPSSEISEGFTWANLSQTVHYPASINVDPAPDLLFRGLPGRIRSCRIFAGASLAGLVALIVWHRHTPGPLKLQKNYAMLSVSAASWRLLVLPWQDCFSTDE